MGMDQVAATQQSLVKFNRDRGNNKNADEIVGDIRRGRRLVDEATKKRDELTR